MKQTLFALALIGLLAWGIWRQPSAPTPIAHHEFFALGTLMQISIADPVPDGLLARLSARLASFEHDWSVRGDGALARLNQQLADSARAELPETLRAGFERGRQACQHSGGLFDPGVGGLVQLWGFDDESRFRSAPPGPEELASALASRQSLCDATLDAHIELPAPGGQFNFGASAKGRAVDLLIEALRAEGIHNAIVNGGGDLKAIGQRPDRAWRVGIRHPRPIGDAQDILASLSLKDGEAVFSSGDYERYFEFEDRRYHHILDPRSGAPARSARSATVLHQNAEWADAAVTALFVAGPELAEAVMRAMDISHYLLIDASGGLHLSDAMRERLDLAP